MALLKIQHSNLSQLLIQPYQMSVEVICHLALQNRLLTGGVLSRVQEPGAQYDGYFERQDFGGSICFGIDSLASEIRSQLEELRDTGKIVHLYGILQIDAPDYNGSQI